MYDRRSPIALDSVEASEKKSKKVDVKPFRGCQDECVRLHWLSLSKRNILKKGSIS
jgi:hypothetical protein